MNVESTAPQDKTILMVDDEDSMIVAESIFGREGINTFSAQNGDAALEILTHEHVDLLLTDIHMPGMDGFELIRKALEVRQELLIVVMSADSNALREMRDLQTENHAIKAILEKPMDPRRYLRRIKAVLSPPSPEYQAP